MNLMSHLHLHAGASVARSILRDEAIPAEMAKSRNKSEHLEHEIASSGFALSP